MFRPVILFVLFSVLTRAQSAGFRWIRQLGGLAGQAIVGLATDSGGNTYVAGNTTSLDFPVRGAVQPHPAGSGLYRVDGPGGNWQNLYQSGVTTAWTVATDPRDPNRVYAGTPTAILRSRDQGGSWTTIATPGVRINAISVDPTDSGVLYAATSGPGILKSNDDGVTWAPINNGIPVADIPATGAGGRFAYGVWPDPNHPGVLFASVFQSALLRSSDGGASWTAISSPALYSPLPSYNAAHVAFDPFRAGTVYASDSVRAAVSTDEGVTWTPLTPVDSSGGQPDPILPDPKREGVLYGATRDGTVWASTDRGVTWTGKPGAGSSVMTADLGTGAIYSVAGNRIVVTTDGFQTTTAAGPPNIVTLVALSASGGHLYLGAQNSTDVFVMKLDPQGNTIYATYFGGSNSDTARAMAIDPAGNVYVTGLTQSADFPLTKGAYSAVTGVFLFKLNTDGSLAYSTGVKGGTPNALAVDATGHAFIGGVTSGFDGLPVTSGAYQTKFNGTFCGPGCVFSVPPTNGFLTEFDTSGAALVFSSFLGALTESVGAVMVLPDGSPVVAGGYTLYHFDASGSSLLQSRGFSGNMRALAVDAKGNILLTGAAAQPDDNPVPTTPGAYQSAPYPIPSLPGSLGNTGSGDVFVTRLDTQLNILNSTLLAGEASDVGIGVAAGADGGVFVGGSTYSKAFPARGPVQTSFSPTTGFVTELNADFSNLIFSTYTGDNRPFYVRSVAATPDGSVIFGGSTSQAPYYSYDALFPDPTIQTYVVRVDPLGNPAPRIDSVVNAASQLGTPLSPGETIQVHGDGFADDATLYLNGDALPLQAHDRTTLEAAVPATLALAGAATIEIRGAGGKTSVLAPVASASPGVFSQDGSGMGKGYILNKDGSLNSPANPAKEGEPITICATGVGTMTFDHGYAVTDAVVDVRVDGFSAAGIAAVLGPVQGLPGDVYQISVFVPRPSDFADSNPNLKGFVMPTRVAVTLIVNGAVSQAGIALSVGHSVRQLPARLVVERRLSYDERNDERI